MIWELNVYVNGKKKTTIKDSRINDGRIYSDIYILRKDSKYNSIVDKKNLLYKIFVK